MENVERDALRADVHSIALVIARQMGNDIEFRNNVYRHSIVLDRLAERFVSIAVHWNCLVLPYIAHFCQYRALDKVRKVVTHEVVLTRKAEQARPHCSNRPGAVRAYSVRAALAYRR